MRLRRTRFVIDPDQLEHPLVQRHEALVKREADLGVELAAWARHADSRLGGQYVSGLPKALRTSVKLSRVIRERKRLEARMVRRGVMIEAAASGGEAQTGHMR